MNDTASAPSKKPSLLIIIVALLALAGGIVAASLLLRPAAVAPETVSATYLPGGKPIAEFQLVDHNSQQFGLDNLKEKWTFVFFGYTFCPDICPTTMMTMAAVEEAIKQQSPEAPVQTVFVSVDPKRDTPARLAQYVPYFSSDFIGVTGKEAELSRLGRNLGSIFVVHEPEPGQSHYLVDHSSAVLLINPSGQLQAVFTAPHQQESMVRDFQAIRNFYRSR